MNIQRMTFAAVLAVAPLLAGPAFAAEKHQINPPLLPQYRHAAPAAHAHSRTAAHAHRHHGWRHSLRYGYRPVHRRFVHANHNAWNGHRTVRTHRRWTHRQVWAYRDAGSAPVGYAYGYGYASPNYYRPPAYRPGFFAVLGNVTGALLSPLTSGGAPCW